MRGATGLSTFAHFGLSIRRPVTWKVYDYPEFSFSFTTLVGFLSPLRLHDPCTQSRGSLSCAPWPLRTLPAGSIIIRWTDEAFRAGQTMVTLRGAWLTVHGHPARLTVAADSSGICPRRAQRAITFDIQRSREDYLQMQACIRGPGARGMQAAVLAMVHSARVQWVD